MSTPSKSIPQSLTIDDKNVLLDDFISDNDFQAKQRNIGDTFFNAQISILSATFLAQGLSSTDVDTATNKLVGIIACIWATDPALEAWVIRFFGTLIAEILSHEIYHALLPVAFELNVNAASNAIDTGDIMDQGQHRSFAERRGIIALSTLPDDFLDNLIDAGRGAINKLTGSNLAHIHANFPIPPAPPFGI